MQITKESLHARYSSMDTEVLLQINRSSDLTPMARSVLREVLDGRGVILEQHETTDNPYQQPKSNLIRDRKFSMRTFFRVLVVGNSLLFMFFIFLYPYLEGLFLSAETLDMLSVDGYGGAIPYQYWIAHLVQFAWLAVFVGLYQFRVWARGALIWLCIIGILIGPFWGLSVQTALSGTIGWLMTLVDGALLALCYFSSIAREFVPNGDAENGQ